MKLRRRHYVLIAALVCWLVIQSFVAADIEFMLFGSTEIDRLARRYGVERLFGLKFVFVNPR